MPIYFCVLPVFKERWQYAGTEADVAYSSAAAVKQL